VKSGQLFAIFCGKVLLLDSTLLVNGEMDWKKADHAPLLLIGRGNDHTAPPAVPTAVLERCSRGGGGLVEYKQSEGRTHHIVGQKGWQEVADYSLKWAEERLK
jgi:non-heme chloroperoxidase